MILRTFKKIRRAFFTWVVKRDAAAVGEGLNVHHLSRATKNCYLGNNVNFNGLKISGKGEVRIGDNFHSGDGCYIITSNHNYNTGNAIPYDNTYITKDVLIEDNVWIGINVIILGGVTIGEGAIIQAGSLVLHDVPKYAIAGGHPARVFSQRDVAHYEKLKAEKKFF
mgnify:CR=1 FL=1